MLVWRKTVAILRHTRYGSRLYAPFDAGRGWARRPFIGSFAALLLGVGAGIGMWVLLNGSNPLT